jgi:hypothetical protein
VWCAEATRNRIDPGYFGDELDRKHQKKRCWSRKERGHRYKPTSPDEIERCEKAEAKRAQPSDQDVIFANAPGQDHANQISRKNRFTVCPTRKSAKPEQ